MLATLLIAALPALTADDLRLELAAAKGRIVQGEPTKLVLTWSALRLVQVREGRERLLIDDGTGYRPYHEAFEEETDLVVPQSWPAGTVRRTEYQIGVEETDHLPVAPIARLVFARPGAYRAKVAYDQVSSNEITVEVLPAEGDLQQLVAGPLSARSELLTQWVGGDDAAAEALEQLRRSYPDSPHFARPLLVLFRERFSEALKRDVANQRPPQAGEAGQVYDELRSLDMTNTAFGDDQTLLVADFAAHFGLEQGAAAYREVIERYPNSLAGERAREWLRTNGFDTGSPVLAASASPSTLWPPNNKLVTITVAVNVTDDIDPRPVVRLASITCDDGCSPAQDIAGAALGSDDRAFQVRATRKGGGAGRTYTITYAATDASGNEASVQTAVRVPHDQGK